MFTIKISSNSSNRAQEITNIDSDRFKQLLKTKWDEIHDQLDVLRYKVKKMRERIVDNRYILLLNPDRGYKRREPEFIDSIHKPYNPDEFNFNKTSSKEHLFTMHENNSTDTHLFLVNVSPISQYHTLLCPSVNKCLPQVVTEDSIRLVLDVKFMAQDRDLKIGFNSLCAFASVNHLHYHLMYEKNTFHVATDKCIHIKGPLYLINNIVPAFCFQVTKDTLSRTVKYIFSLTDYLVSKSIGHNILVTDGEPVVPGCKHEVPGSENAKPEWKLVVPAFENATPECNQVVTGSENAIPECNQVVTGSENAIPECNQVVTGSENAIPECNQVVPGSENAIPNCKQVVPGSENAIPNCKQVVPGSENAVPECKQVPGCNDIIREDSEVVRVLVTPRLSTAGVKMLTSFNVAVLELSGWFPVFDPEHFDTFSAADLEKELSKWKLPNFEELCDEVKLLY